MALDAIALQKAVHSAGHTWIVRTPPATEHHGLGRLPSDPQKVQEAVNIAHLMLQARIRLVPPAPSGAAPALVCARRTQRLQFRLPPR